MLYSEELMLKFNKPIRRTLNPLRCHLPPVAVPLAGLGAVAAGAEKTRQGWGPPVRRRRIPREFRRRPRPLAQGSADLKVCYDSTIADLQIGA